MILASLELQNFRSYKKITLPFSPNATLIVGNNATGKTNILEAIMMVSTGKSFRAIHDRDVVRFETEMAKVTGNVVKENQRVSVALFITQGMIQGQKAPMKKFFVNGIARRATDLSRNLKTVLFWPQDLDLVTDSPSMRRKYLDTVLSQTDDEYKRSLASYERGLRQRNMLLDRINKRQATRNQLLFWDQLLIKTGGYITKQREAYLLFTTKVTDMDIKTFRASYEPSRINEARLLQYASEEVFSKSTLVGPHRDDFHILMETPKKNTMVNVREFGSRGEQRSAVLWLKCVEASYVEHVYGERPVVLLDDIFSEFDKKHRDVVRSLMRKQQTILTTADTHIEKELADIDVIRLPL